MMQIGLESMRPKQKPANKDNPNVSGSALWTSEMVERYETEVRLNLPHTLPSPFLKGKPGLKKPHLNFQPSEEEKAEIVKCGGDICYFVEKYCKTMTDDGVENITLRPYQRRILQDLKDNRMCCWVATRQIGKCQVFDSTILMKNNDIEEVAPMFKLWLKYKKNKNIFDYIKYFLYNILYYIEK